MDIFNGIRSSRKLEKECIRNIELQWLCGSLKPNYHSIADFRKNSPTADIWQAGLVAVETQKRLPVQIVI